MERDNFIGRQWDSMTDEEQRGIVRAAVLRKARRYGLQVLNSHGRELDDFINEAFKLTLENLTPDTVQQINAKRTAQGKDAITLVGFIHMMANRAISNLAYQNRKADERDGGELDEEQHSSRDTAEAVIIAVDLAAFMEQQSERDRQIIELIGAGLTERETGAELHISGVAVHKRLVKIRAALMSLV